MLGEARFKFTLALLEHHVFAAREDNHLGGGDGELTVRKRRGPHLRLGGGAETLHGGGQRGGLQRAGREFFDVEILEESLAAAGGGNLQRERPLAAPRRGLVVISH